MFLAIQSLTIVFSMVLCAVVLGEKITGFMVFGAVMIAAGTVLMMKREEIEALKAKGDLEGRAPMDSLCGAVPRCLLLFLM